nr:unnamed protein product [Callosobruchus analis]
MPMPITEEQINSIHETRDALNTDEVSNCEEIPKPVGDQSNTVHENEKEPQNGDGQNDKVSETYILPQSNRDMPNPSDEQNKIGSNVEVAIAPIQQYDVNNIKSTESQSAPVSHTHILRKDKFFIGHQVVTEIETIKELGHNVDDGSISILNNMRGGEKEAESIPDGVKSELQKSASRQEDAKYEEADSQQLKKTTHFNNEHQLGPSSENKQPEMAGETSEGKSKHKEVFNENQGRNRGNIEHKNIVSFKDSHGPTLKHEEVEDEPKDENQVKPGNETSGAIGDNTECNDTDQLENEQYGTDGDKSENKQDAENQNMKNSERQNDGVTEEACSNDEEADVEADSENVEHHDHGVDSEDTKQNGPAKDNTAGDNLNAHQDSDELNGSSDCQSSPVGQAGQEEVHDNGKENEEFETTECQSDGTNILLEKKKDDTENDTGQGHNHHIFEHSEDVEEEQDVGKKHKQHDGTQIIIINNARLRDDRHGIEAKRFVSHQNKRSKKQKVLVKKKRNFKVTTAKIQRYYDKRKSMRRRRKEKHYVYGLESDNDRRDTANSDADLNKHYMGRRLKNAEDFESGHDVSAACVVNSREQEAVKQDDEKLPVEERYIGRKLKDVADYIYDPSIEKSEEEYDTNDATEIIDVTEKRERKNKGAVEGDYGDEEDSMTEKKNGGKKMIKKTKNEFAHPRTTTEKADDDYYYDEIEGMEDRKNIKEVPRKEKATIGKKVHRKMHSARTKQGRTAFREPRQSDYSKTNPEFQQWPKFMISDQENEEQLRKRSLSAKKPVKSKKEKFKKSLKDFFLKPAPKKRFDMEGLDFGGSTSGSSDMKTSASGKGEGSSGTDTASLKI